MGDLKTRFDRTRLVEALSRQALLAGDVALVDQLADQGELVEVAAGGDLITQGEWDDDVYFILAGEFLVLINGSQVNVRKAGVHVGELSGINPARARTATLRAKAPSLVLRVPMAVLKDLTKDDADFWRRTADVVATRLDERNEQIGKINDIPRVFVISSAEAKPVMDEIVRCLDGKEIAVDTWDMGTFGVSEYAISSLMDRIEASDFTLSIVAPDDVLVSRKKQSKVARDNVHLEYGISLGMLGRRRSVLLVCASEGVKLPSDVAGLTTLRYSHKTEDEMKRSVRKACLEMRDHVRLEGVLQNRRAGAGAQ
jgi:predicted nucleotide-binding protein